MNQPIQEGVRLFNDGAWFEAHEVFEELWLGATGPARKDLFKGLVQACAALIQHSRGQTAGALRLLDRSLARLEASGGAGERLDMARLIGDLRRMGAALREGKGFVPPVIAARSHL